ncbi:FAD-binding domain-containing protein [Dichomitus squalens LYAD-421 SS1]|uniref:FAD-binding domain-containing protein n=1 Tax=Dichomitus squalens (strain LYAD-421) TaxID=732165 RepID=R7SQG8_DICSQ|nr:FAD-binding domain-containing protein [Dichomitus squalens LYAD-421 SS1]EJF58331.1 FAD-binding domain-containing protein [Dichomitus squalens LYAD-421 SS1]
MRRALVSIVIVSAITSVLGKWVPYSQLQARDDSALLSCLKSKGLDPVVQGSPNYTSDSAPFNRRLHWKPVAIVYPEDAKGVSAAVKCAAQNHVKVNARCGGHSYAAFALGGEDGHLTVSLDKLRHLSQSGNTSTIGGGNHLGDVALYLWQNGKRAMAHGTCPYVGIGGHAGQGGFGLPSRAWGLLADQVQSLEIVTADGQIRNASLKENADLFWAATGAGASFGIITSFTTVTRPAPNSTAFAYEFKNYTYKEASAGLQAWQAFASNSTNKLDPNVGLQIHVDPNPSAPHGVVFSVSGVYYGADKAKVNSTFAPLLKKLGTPTSILLQEQDWITSVLHLADAKNISQLNTTLASDTHDYFYATSTFISEQRPMVQAASDALFKYFYGPGTNTSIKWFAIFDLYGGGDSAITKVGPDYNAFNARDALYSIQYYGTIPHGTSDRAGIDFIQGIKKAVENDTVPKTQFKEYVNYIDSEYSAEEAHARYYPTHSANLTALKNKYDLNRTFHFPQDF